MSRLRRLAVKLAKIVKWRAADALFAAGLGGRLHRNRPGGRIIVYHGVDAAGSLEHNTRFISSATLDRHLRHFRDHFAVATLDDYFAGRRDPDRLTVAVTFDDGYTNNLERALPVIEAVGVPVTIFVTGCAETDGEILWPDLLDLATPAVRQRVVIDGEGWRRGRRGELVSEATGESLKLRCKHSSWDFISEMMAVLRPFFESRAPTRFADYWRHLDAEQIRRLSSSELVAIGSHGAHHTSLGAIDHAAACDELRRSKAYLENAVDAEVRTLAYPDGSYTREIVSSAAEIGFDRQFVVAYLYREDARTVGSANDSAATRSSPGTTSCGRSSRGGTEWNVVTTALNRDNLVDLIPLYRPRLGKVIDRAYLEAKYDTGLSGHAVFRLSRLHLRRPARRVLRRDADPRLERMGGIELAAQCCDAVTIEEFAGRGLFTQLGRLTESRLRDFGVRTVYAFLNQNSEPAALGKLDWTGIHRLRRFTVPVLTIPLEGLSRKISAGPAFRAWVTTATRRPHPARSRPSPTRSRERSHGQPPRPRSSSPTRAPPTSFIIAVADVKMWVKTEGGLLIGDIERRPEAEILGAVHGLRRIARSLGIARITFQVSPGTYLERIFSRHFAGFDSWLLGGKSFDPRFPIEALRCTFGDLDTF